MDAEFRLHRSDNDESQALFNSKWEYSYRLVFRVPLDVAIRHTMELFPEPDRPH
jgi:hypothetical protein